MRNGITAFSKPYIALTPPNTTIFDWVENTDKKWESAKQGAADHYRQCEIAWLDPTEEIQKELRIAASTANETANWFFDIKRIEPLQYTVYNEEEYIDWHIDIDQYDFSGEFKGLRKLSMTMVLNDDYEGGYLQLEIGSPKMKNRLLNFKAQTGTMIFFPSTTWHRVTPVIRGVRKTLVVWFLADYG
jgi:PKHD-type hydroxylase